MECGWCVLHVSACIERSLTSKREGGRVRVRERERENEKEREKERG